jgi:hypothetical protein
MNPDDIKKAKELSEKVKALGKFSVPKKKETPKPQKTTKKDLSFINKLSGFEQEKKRTPEFRSKVNIPVRDTSDTPQQIANKLNTLPESINKEVIRDLPTVDDFITALKNLKGNDRIDITNIRNGENLARMANGGFNMNDQRWHGGGISNITGLITAGTNVTITGSGTTSSPYIINASGGGTPGGANTNVQYNDSGVFGGDSNFTWNKVTQTFNVGDVATGTAFFNVFPLGLSISQTVGFGTNDGGKFFLSSTATATPNDPNYMMLNGADRIFQVGLGGDAGMSIPGYRFLRIDPNFRVYNIGDQDFTNNGTWFNVDDDLGLFNFYNNNAVSVEIGSAFTTMYPWSASAGGTHGIRFKELTANGTNSIGFSGPDARTSNDDLQLILPANNPTAGQTMVFSAPSGNVSTATWSSVASGTVTSVSVVSANGFAGTVATATTTPAITISTTVTGVLKGNGTAISAAVAATDYVSPGVITTDGITMSTARLLGRTTAGTGAIEEITVGAGLNLTSGSLTATGSGASIITTSFSGGLQVPASTTTFNAIGAITLNGTEANRKFVIPFAGTISRLFLVTTTTQSGTGSLVVTVRNNGVDTALTLTVGAGAVAATFSDVSNSFSVAAGDLLSFKYVNNASAAGAEMQTIGIVFN